MDEDNKLKLVKIHLTACKRDPEHMHITGIEPVTDVDVVYDAPDSDDVLASSSLGWSTHPSWDKNWERTFGDKPADDTLN